MPVGTQNTRQYYRLNGKSAQIETGTKDNLTTYDYIEGNLSSINYKEDEYEGDTYYKYELIFTSEQGEEVLQVTADTVAANGILNCLAWAAEEKGGIGWVKIRPYKPTGARYTAVWMEMDGEKMEWLVDYKKTPSEPSKRQAYFKRFYERVKEQLDKQQPKEAAQKEVAVDLDTVDEDLPF